VASFTETLGAGLARRGFEVVVWAPDPADAGGSWSVRTLPDVFAPGSRRALEREVRKGDIVLLQYTPNALGARGMNVGFCRWLLKQSRAGWDVRVFFHEPYFYFGWRRPRRNVLAAVHRLMAGLLLRAGRVAYVSTPAWEPLLRRYAPRGLPICWVPVSAGIEPVADSARVAACRARLAGDNGALILGHFSSFPPDVRAPLRAVLRASLGRLPHARAVCIGNGSHEFVNSATAEPWAGRVSATGSLGAIDVSCAIQACDLFVQPYPDGATARRTTLLTLLAHGAAVVTTSGALTESLWAAAGDLFVTAPAGNHHALATAVVSLAGDPVRRASMGRLARQVYERDFSGAASLRALLEFDRRAASARETVGV
jgi:glycosyltransferase involved in cell wall biosynthesis